MLIGVMVLNSYDLLSRIEDLGAEAYMPIYRHMARSDEATPFVFVDINEAAYDKWGKQPWVPRDKLYEIIEKVAEADPLLVVVDVDLSYPYCNQGTLPTEFTNRTLVENVDKLLEGDPTLHIVLMQSAPVASQDPLIYHPFPCGPVFDLKSPRAHWVVPAVRADADLVVRDWPLFSRMYNETNTPITVPGLAILSLAASKLSKNEPEGPCFRDVDPYSAETESNRLLELVTCLIQDHKSDEFSNIIFTIPWKLDDDEKWPLLESGTPLLTIISADSLIEASRIASLAGRIVIVGGSYLDSRDYHATPIGIMPGAIVIVNAIHSLFEFDVVRKPRPIERLIVGALTVVVAAVVFAAFHPVIASGISVAILVVVTGFVGYYKLWSGVWLDATLPVLAIATTHWVSEIVEVLCHGVARR